MIALVSPAKTLDFASPFEGPAATRPRFAAEADALATAAAKLTAPKLQALMGISPKLARLNVDRFRGFDQAPQRPAIRAFKGDVYLGFEAASLDAVALAFADRHLRILSGLYGLLRPADAIRPYRLEMGTRWAPGRARDLYGWWGGRVAQALADDLAHESSGTILNLASKEYWHVVAQAPPAGARIVSIDFREEGPDGLRFNSFGAKRARGMMARWMCEHHVTRIDDMKGFDSDGYRYRADGSDADTWRFVRAAGAAA